MPPISPCYSASGDRTSSSMLRRALTILSLIGLLFSVGLWGATYYRIQYWGRHHGAIALGTGCVTIYAYGPMDRTPQVNEWQSEGFDGFSTVWIPRISASSTVTRFGASSVTQHLFYYASPVGGWIVVIPLWLPTMAFIGVGGVPLVRTSHRRRKRKKLGLCVKCGYDLRGSKERCPECGTEFSR